RRIERLLRERPAPAAPAQFTARTLGRVRRARWRTEQFLDVSFNAAIALIVAGVVAAIWMLAHRTGLAAVSNDAVELFATGLSAFARRVGPSLGIWWWAERDMQA